MSSRQVTVGSLFTGIGIFDLGLERVLKSKTIWQVEREPFCLRVLEKHWPTVERHTDVCTASALPYADIICGGFPCQDISAAGKGVGIDGKSSGLWREFARIVDETKPRVVAIENSPLLSRRGLNRVLGDLATMGYLGTWGVVSAADTGACHQRDRLFIIAAHPLRINLRDEQGWRGGSCWTGARQPRHVGTPGFATDADGGQDRGRYGAWRGWVPASPVRGMDDGFAAGVDGPRRRRPAGDRRRLTALGNAIVLPVAESIATVINQLVDLDHDVKDGKG